MTAIELEKAFENLRLRELAEIMIRKQEWHTMTDRTGEPDAHLPLKLKTYQHMMATLQPHERADCELVIDRVCGFLLDRVSERMLIQGESFEAASGWLMRQLSEHGL